MNNIHIGNAGQHSVASMLERKGYTVGLLMSNEPNFDILIAAPETGNMYKIQVKTTPKTKRRWVLSSKDETNVSKDLYYVFVKLADDGADEYHIVPSEDVSKYISESHQNWLKTPRRDGGAHKDNKMRIFEIKDESYLNNWSILN